jgi:serine protease Do
VQSLGYTGTEGALIKGANRGTPAYGALEPGDIVTAVNGDKIKDSTELRNTVASLAPGSSVKLTVWRNGSETTVNVTLGEQPDDLRTAAARQPGGSRGGAGEVNPEYLGLRVAPVSPEAVQTYGLDPTTKGAIVVATRQGSPAQRAGLAVGDAIIRINSTRIETPDDVTAALAKADINKGINFIVANRMGTRSVFVQADAD